MTAPVDLFPPSRMVSLDLETHLIEPGILAPRVVCGSQAVLNGDVAAGMLLSRGAAIGTLRTVLLSDCVLVGANVAFDLGCLAVEDPDSLPAVFRAYAEGRVYDVLVAQALDAIAGGHLGVDPRTGGPLRRPSTGKVSKRYSLEVVCDLVLGRTDAKERDYWRTRYATLDGVPLEDWPEDARRYPVNDAVNALEVAVAQVTGEPGDPRRHAGPHRNLGDLPAQVETAWAMHLGAMWGLRVDGERLEALRRRTGEAHASFAERFRELGFLRGDGTEDKAVVRGAVAVAYGARGLCEAGCYGGVTLSAKTGKRVACPDCSGTGLNCDGVPRTDKGSVSSDRDTLAESGDPDLVAYSESEPEKVRRTYVPWLEGGVDRPLVLRPNVLVASGRTSYDGPVQTLPRHGGVRECVRARDGYLLCSVDYSGLELCTLAQVCLWTVGRSEMAKAIRRGGDAGALHTSFAATVLGVSEEEMSRRLRSGDGDERDEARRFRQAAKAANFGFPGGMGPAKFLLANRKRSVGQTTGPDGTVYSGLRPCLLLSGVPRCGAVKLTEWERRPCPPTCRDCLTVVHEVLRPRWFERWPEVRDYFHWVKQQIELKGEVRCLGPGERVTRVRGGVQFTDAANNGFQALAADGGKAALRAAARECYLGVRPDGSPSPLAGARPVLFLHDEVVAELPGSSAPEAADRLAEVMVAEMSVWLPDVPVRAEAKLMRYWSKDAEPVRDAAGRLVAGDR